MLRIRLIGEMALEIDGTPASPPASRRARSLLAWLALHPGPHARGEVAACFWPDVLDSSARTNLRSALMTLRNELGPAAATHLEATRDAIGLARDGETWVDAVEFGALLDHGDLEKAVGIGDAELLPGLDDDWAYSARDAHRERLIEAFAALAAAAEAAADLAGAVRWTRRQAFHDPLSEDVHRELIRRLGEAGDRPSALATFAQLRTRLADELHMAPSAATRELAEQIRREDGTAARSPVEALLPTALGMRRGTPFVGRAAALERLLGAWAGARERGPQLWLIAGEPGIGKTRLAAEFAAAVHGDGAPVLYGRAYPEPLTPYQPFAEALGVARFADLVEGAGGDRYALFDAVASELARPPGALLVLDDVHWADRPTLLLLQHAVRSAQPGPLLVVATYRHAEIDAAHPLAEALGELRRDHPFERIVLDGLGTDELGALIAGVTGSAGDARFVDSMRGETEGNPFFVEEVLRHLAESGSLEERMATGSLGAMGVPEGVKDIVGRRLARLGEHPNHVLAIASVVGRRFGLDVLERLWGRDEDELIAALDEALAADLIAEEPGAPARFSFTHALVRETAYEALSRTRRVRLHRRVGRALEDLHRADQEPYLGELAHHFAEAAEPGDADDAIRYAAAAGAWAMEQLAYEDAVLHYRAALATLRFASAVPEIQRCDLLLELGAAEARAGEGVEARAHFEEAAELAERIGSAARIAEAALGYGADVLGGLWWLSVGVSDERMVDLLERALAMLPPDGSLRARVLAQRAMQLYWTSGREHGMALSAQAVEMARAAGQPTTLLYTLAARHAALWGPDSIHEQLVVADEVVRLAESSGDHERGLVGLGWRLTDLLVLGDRPAVDEAVDTLVRWAAELRQPAHTWYATHAQATLALLDGRFEAVEELVSTALSFNPQVHDQSASQSWAIQMYALRAEQGRLEELEAVMSASAELYEAVPAWRGALASLYAEIGREAECRVHFERLAEDDFRGLPRDGNWLTGVAYSARACAYLGDSERAVVLHRQLLPYNAINVVTGLGIDCIGSVELYLGLLAATAGLWDDADRHFMGARTMHERLRSPPWIAHTDLEQARMLIARGRADDRDRARELLAHAHAPAEGLGMTRLCERVRLAEAESTLPRA
jgi:DNA-binding SARP family transcriptional activator/tetratricopeptide (TPR) repeat protein